MARRKKSKKSVGVLSILGIVLALLIYFSQEGFFKEDFTHKVDEPQGSLVNVEDSAKLDEDEPNVESAENEPNVNVGGDESTLSGLEVYFFDVGQADSILILCDDEVMLIDAGNNPDGRLICDYLESLGISSITYLVGTHPHEDHIGGLDDIINDFVVENIFMPKKSATTRTFEDVLNSISAKAMKVKSPSIGDTFSLGDATFEIMMKDDAAEDANDSSIVIELSYGENKFLFTGDTESGMEDLRKWDDVDVLKVAHHGSSSSSSTSFLAQVKPEISIISLGEENDYGHPHKETIDRLKSIGTAIYRTDLDGTILIESDGLKITVTKLDISLDGNS